MIEQLHDPSPASRAALSGHRVVIFADLTLASLAVALLSRAVRQRVVYFNPRGILREPGWIKRLAKLGIALNDYAELPGFNPYGRLKVAEDCAAKIASQLLTADYLRAIEPWFPPVIERPAKIRTLLFDALFQAFWKVGDPLALACYFAESGARVTVWHRQSIETALLHRLQVLPAKCILPVRSALLVRMTAKMLARSHNMLRAALCALVRGHRQSLNGPVRATTAATEQARDLVLFFPHKGTRYGNLYEKTQYYFDEEDQPLSRRRMLHIELMDQLSASENQAIFHEYEKEGRPCAGLRMARWRLNWRAPLTFAGRSSTRRSSSLLLHLLTAIVARRTHAWLSGLAALPRARLALIGFDYLFPRPLAYALQAGGTAVVALQDRYISVSRRSHALILDGYLTQSERCRSQAQNNPFSVLGRVDVVGDYRAAVLQHLRSRRRKETGPIVACYDFHSEIDPIENAALAFNNWKNNLIFYEAILAAAAALPSAKFIIRGKNADWISIPFFASIVDRMQSQSNIEISREFDSLDGGYRLAARADCIVARYTSLVDQALVVGIPVLIYEEMWSDSRCVSWWESYEGYPILVRSKPELITRLCDVIVADRYMSPGRLDALRHTYYDVEVEQIKPRIRAALESWLGIQRGSLGCTALQHAT